MLLLLLLLLLVFCVFRLVAVAANVDVRGPEVEEVLVLLMDFRQTPGR